MNKKILSRNKKKKFRLLSRKFKYNRLIINKTLNNIYVTLVSIYPENKILFSLSTLNKNIKFILKKKILIVEI
ncbi:hypothetical protein [Candidatus Nardonella dryophthoridicola]|uniref:50S ribosomal protein L18 n=1 Tax=endosymbiont of Metamasius hemipterus TaxID=204627 RepID=A0ABT0TW74_9GAMM|nr:hypothetical protein [Candidatus Nardonella dryophthoridicola]MCM0158246.1 hypothetical protein [endosymbiont of Metamasius hemipterus]